MIDLRQGDCLDIMPGLEADSVDMVLTDPPYGTTACKWDSVIPLEPMWDCIKHVVRDRAAIVMTASQPFTTALISSNMKWFKYEWVWIKTRGSGFINCKNRPISIHENIIVFSNGTIANCSKRLMKYNPQGLKYTPYHKKRLKPMTAKLNGFLGTRPSHVAEYEVENTNYPKSAITFPNPNNDNLHPTQKPVTLMEYLIRTYTNKGDTVLDFTMGSGTTGVACVNTGRSFIGIEKEPEYFEIAKARIAAAKRNLQYELFDMEDL
jgi:site-specific DNA-methyltransferase (adenine-specific)